MAPVKLTRTQLKIIYYFRCVYFEIFSDIFFYEIINYDNQSNTAHPLTASHIILAFVNDRCVPLLYIFRIDRFDFSRWKMLEILMDKHYTYVVAVVVAVRCVFLYLCV